MSKRKELQLSVLSNYFTIEGNIATLQLVYDTFSELINPNFGDVRIEKLNDKLFADIAEAVDLLPKRFKLNLHIVIKDFGEYAKEECEEIIKHNLYLLGYRTIKENHKKLISGWSLIATGAAILIVSYFLRKYDLWFDLINISGTLFVWEGVNTAFIERNIENRSAIRLAKSIEKITIESAESADGAEGEVSAESADGVSADKI